MKNNKKNKKNLLLKTTFGVVSALAIIAPITVTACGATATNKDKPINPIPSGVPSDWVPVETDWINLKPAVVTANSFTGTFSSAAKREEFLNITTTIPKDAFQNEVNLTSITLPNVTTVGEGAFSMDSPGTGNQLTVVNLPKVESIADNAFHNANVVEMNFPHLTSLGLNLFNQATLRKISLSSLTTIAANTFENVVTLTELSLPHVHVIGANAFNLLVNLDTLDLPMVTTIGSLAFGSAVIKTINMPKVETIADFAFGAGTFQNTPILTLPKATEIDTNAFYSAQFTMVNLPDVTSLKSSAFVDSPLTVIRIGSLTIDTIESSAFKNAQPNAEVFVADKTLWTDPVKLSDIFGPNYTTLRFENIT